MFNWLSVPTWLLWLTGSVSSVFQSLACTHRMVGELERMNEDGVMTLSALEVQDGEINIGFALLLLYLPDLKSAYSWGIEPLVSIEKRALTKVLGSVLIFLMSKRVASAA